MVLPPSPIAPAAMFRPELLRRSPESDREAFHAAQDKRIVPIRLATGEPDVRQSLAHPYGGDLGLETRKRCAQAEMDAVTERQVRILLAADVKALRIVESFG